MSYYVVRTAVVRAMRRIPGVRSVAQAILADELAVLSKKAKASRAPGLNIRAGHLVDEERRGTLPTVVVLMTGMQPGDADRLAATLEQALYLAGSFRPLVVVDSGEFSPFRARGLAVEHVMGAEAFAEVNPAEPYSEYVHGRVTSIVRQYRAHAVVPLDPRALPNAHRLSVIGVCGQPS